ncbi:hypothetical protein PQJ75_11845 [Rhodoplanes sp. TEM]|uniref:Uncharacterized protein n=1 Tax=Rhodoplanes tepidamans TaxID=200616 RepID=A0ABT5J4R9_RHOTP|nr:MULTISPECIES: hypothetical protein [Rhodoplanes]MDC7784518.1 hypothetical protein [Rhodoplanes tepidamans]MDC7984425.1 hypothetical protein [Rhodoplanes sp. TEM]MDQ0355746.1 hypothetical protein [Rhodoplanes tepidamans]
MRTTRPGGPVPYRSILAGLVAAGLLAPAAVAQAPWPDSPPAASGGTAPWPSDPPQSGGAAAPWPSSPPRAGMASTPSPMGAAPMGAGPMSPRGGAGGQPPCMEEFSKLQAETDKRGKAAKAGVDKKLPREELCKLFTSFAGAIGNWAKFAREKAPTCGIPPKIVEQLKVGSVNIGKTAKQACAAGPMGPGPAAAGPPSLSEALGTARSPLGSASGGKPSTGTFNTLTGSSIAR